MAVPLQYRNAEQLAHAIHEVVRASGFPNASPRPWNPYESHRHFWWIMPTKEFPCYQTGKFCVLVEDTVDCDVACGMEIERGFGQPVAAISSTMRDQRRVMDRTWMWHSLISDMKNSKLAQAFEKASNQLQHSLRFNVLGIRYAADEKDPYLVQRLDKVDFDVDGETIQSVPSSNLTEGILLPETAGCTNLTSLADCLMMLPDPDWTWVDLIITAPFDFKPNDSSALDARELYTKLLAPFTPWFA